MNDLKTLNDQLALIRKGQSEIAARLGEIGAERHAIESASNDRAASIASAEQALIDALAAHELNEPADVEGARQRLNDARLMAQNGIESATRQRVLDALKGRHEAEHGALHEKGLSLMAAIREATADALAIMASELHSDLGAAVERTFETEPKLNAVRALLAEHGRAWTLPPVNELQIKHRFNHLTPNVCRASVLAELNA